VVIVRVDRRHEHDGPDNDEDYYGSDDDYHLALGSLLMKPRVRVAMRLRQPMVQPASIEPRRVSIAPRAVSRNADGRPEALTEYSEKKLYHIW
jgi:hypothetical protein